MSTRSQILFRQLKAKVMLYRHSDGYPTGALADLVEFIKWNRGRNNQFDYMVANFIYYMKKDSEQYCDYFETNKMESNNRYATNWKEEKYANNPNLATKLGYGIQSDTIISSWIEYFYDVEVKPKLGHLNSDQCEIVIKCYDADLKEDDVKLNQFLKTAKLIQTVTLDENGIILSNKIESDTKDYEPFKEQVVAQ